MIYHYKILACSKINIFRTINIIAVINVAIIIFGFRGVACKMCCGTADDATAIEIAAIIDNDEMVINILFALCMNLSFI